MRKNCYATKHVRHKNLNYERNKIYVFIYFIRLKYIINYLFR